jgi:predicted O-linked N-acetylglucosamine transferase (SPINDLY family)/glycosyltransferase involved in cell wall biosynthesis
VDLLLQKATAHHEAGQLPQAEALCRQVLQLSPGHSRALYLLGVIASQKGQYANALELIDRAIQVNPDFAEACYSRGNVLFALQQYQAALESYDRAILLRPDHAEAHHNRGSALNILQQPKAALESYEKAILLKPDYEQACSNRATALHALTQFQVMIEKYEKALCLEPDYECKTETKVFESVGKEVVRIAKIVGKAEMKAALDALPPGLHSHPAVCNLRNAFFVKTESSGKDLVFYCFPLDEIWNPRTAREKGIGGAEEAVIWLSRLLHRRGWKVTVYAYCGAQEEDFDGVSWKPYWMWNHRNKQDVTVLWRYPQFATYEINSDRVIADLHDTVAEGEFTPERLQRIHGIFVKSGFQRSLYPGIPDEKFIIIPNGIDAKLFEGAADRDPLLLVNTSSADRSLEAFVDCFEQIKKQVPNVKAQWAYGWGVWDSLYAADAQKLQWKTRMQERMKELGVEERGRLSHDEIARLYHKANIFAYPSEFTEIDCISLSKAMAAGAIPITTDFAAMGEKSQHGGVFIHSKQTVESWRQSNRFHFEIEDPEQKAEFVRETVKLLLDPPSEAARVSMREWARSTFDWNKIAGSWDSALASLAAESAPVPGPVDSAVQQQPGNAAFHLNRGNTLYLAQQYRAALQSYDKAIRIKPDYAEAYHNRGSVLNVLERREAALESYDKAILFKPDYAEAYYNCGNTLYVLQQYQAALDSSDKAILLKPDYADAYASRGNSLYALQQYQAALESYDKAILLKPDYAEAYYNRGNSFYVLQQYPAALQSYDKAILLNPRHAEAHNNRGSVLHALLQYEAALVSFDKAILLKQDYVDAHNNRGNALLALKQYRAALENFDKALLLKPDHEYLRGMRLYMKRLLCDWKDVESECEQLEALIGRGLKAALPFTTLSISDSPAIQRQAAEIYARDKVPARSSAAAIPRRPRRDRIRIGYFSADFHNHATSYLIAELFERHDRSRFEILGFSFGPLKLDEMNQRVSSAMDRFVDVRSMPDREVAELSRKLEVDIAVDLKGFTEDNRAGIFAERAAPIQVSYLGYPGTMGAGYMDYLIADPTLIPQASQQHYSEKILYLPDSYQVNDSRRAISAKPCARADERLPESAFVFCCFNKAYKISPSVFDSWMRILGRVEGSVLWLLEENSWTVENLRAEAARRGIAPQRLVFASSLPVDEHLARHRLADLFLDTLPYNAHTTTSDALRVGLPVLTRTGETFASRVAASLLRATGLPELITATESEFEELAIDLAHHPERLQALRHRLQQNRPTAPLFDCQSFTCHLESTYIAIVERYHAGLPPDHIQIPRRPFTPSS